MTDRYRYPLRKWWCRHIEDGREWGHPMPGEPSFDHVCSGVDTHCPAATGFVLPSVQGHERGEDRRFCASCGELWICGTAWVHARHAFDAVRSYSGVGRCKCGWETAHYALDRDLDPDFDEHLRDVEARGESVIW